MISYMYMTKGQLIDFFGKAEIIENDGILKLQLQMFIKKVICSLLKVESATKLFLYKKFSIYGGRSHQWGD